MKKKFVYIKNALVVAFAANNFVFNRTSLAYTYIVESNSGKSGVSLAVRYYRQSLACGVLISSDIQKYIRHIFQGNAHIWHCIRGFDGLYASFVLFQFRV